MLKETLSPAKVQNTYATYFESWLTETKTRTVKRNDRKAKAFVIFIPQEILDFMNLQEKEKIQVAIRRWPQKPILYHGDGDVSSKLQPHVGVTTSDQTKPASVSQKETSHATSRGTTALTRRSGSRIGCIDKFPSQANIPHAMNGNSAGKQAKPTEKSISSQLVFPAMYNTLGIWGQGGSPHHPRHPSPPPMNEKEFSSYVNTLGTRDPHSSTSSPQSDLQEVNS